ncbi:MAG TPA: RdgB/HAM1 family non-canonical purine NTP pyrophosphatase [Pyrinomonadaceae bacterium]|nr:RdgB/HAM1 family non-canonical purine NTP pyrophosphatase [Pyrinomonadaceae bacterium]
MSPTDLLIGTRNRGKVREIRESLKHLLLTLHDLTEYPNISAPFESGSSYEENATIKARHYARESGIWALADDSGLEVSALNGAPGVKSARFGGDHASDSDRVDLLLSRMSDVPMAQRQATFVCVIVIAETSGRLLHIAEGRCHGRLSMSPAGESGFGYDPIFMSDGYDQTFGEISPSIKNKISHRALALASVREFLMGI